MSPIPISIHAPRTGSDRAERSLVIFSSNFNPRSPHGERRRMLDNQIARTFISIHAPRTGSDAALLPIPVAAIQFQSTLPARGATYSYSLPAIPLSISIHAPRTGSDRRRGRETRRICDFNPRSPHGERHIDTSTFSPRQHFNPRSPHGERHGDAVQRLQPYKFQSTLPARGATRVLRPALYTSLISIHAPRTGSDHLI